MSNTMTVCNDPIRQQEIRSVNRLYYYDAKYRLSLAMDLLNSGNVFVTYAACRWEDTFVKKPQVIKFGNTKIERSDESPGRPNARTILNGRLNGNLAMLNRLLVEQPEERDENPESNINLCVFRMGSRYHGSNPLRDIWFPFLDYLRKDILSRWEEAPHTRNVETVIDEVDTFIRHFIPKQKKEVEKAEVKEQGAETEQQAA